MTPVVRSMGFTPMPTILPTSKGVRETHSLYSSRTHRVHGLTPPPIAAFVRRRHCVRSDESGERAADRGLRWCPVRSSRPAQSKPQTLRLAVGLSPRIL